LRFIRDQKESNGDTLDRETAKRLVRRGNATMAIVIRNQADDSGDVALHADLISDSSDQVASQVVTALVSRSIMMAVAKQEQDEYAVFSKSTVLAKPSASASVTTSSETSSDLDAISSGPPMPAEETASADTATIPSNPVTVIDMMGENKTNPVVSMYAAGIAVMFLLFGATSGGGALLEEKENRTLDRLLSTQMSMDQLLLGKWFYITIIGVVQVTVMFVWAQVVFQVDLVGTDF
jgi:ABC-2 type transport system permease protein